MKNGAWAISRLAASTVTFLLAVSPCGAADDNLQQSFAVETAAAQMRSHHDMAHPMTGDFDRDFLITMISRHQGAVDMAFILLKYGHDERLKRLVQSIVFEQNQEIVYMRSILSELPAQTSNDRTPSRPRSE